MFFLHLTARKFQLSSFTQWKDKYRVLFEIYENFEGRSHKSARFSSRDKTSRQHLKEQKESAERKRERERDYPRGVERRRDAKVASSAEGESHGLTVRALWDKWKRWEFRSSTRTEKIVVNLKQSVSTRGALSGNRKQFNIRSYETCDGRMEHPRLWGYVLFSRPHYNLSHSASFLVKNC